MMSTRRTLLAFGVLTAAFALLVPATAFAQPDAPTNVAGVAPPGAYGTLMVTWDDDDATDPATSYTVYVKPGETLADFDDATAVTTDDADVVAMNVMSGMTATLTGLMHDTEYLINVRGRNAAGLGAPSNTPDNIRTLLPPEPAPPFNVEAKGGDGTFTVMWDEPYAGGGALTIMHYLVDKREVSIGMVGDWVPDPPKMVMGDMTMITFEDLDNGTMYQARVMAVNSAGEVGPASDTSAGEATATVGDEDGDGDGDMEETPALPLFGILALLGGLLAAGRARLRR